VQIAGCGNRLHAMENENASPGCACPGRHFLRDARWYKRLQARVLSREYAPYTRAVERRKAELFGGLEGDVVEIGPGGGVNLRYFAPDVRWTGIEPNPYLHDVIRARARELGRAADVRAGRAEALPFDDGSVDAVACSLVLCSVNDLEGTLREIRRVLRPGGRFVFIEHVADPKGGRRARLQRMVRPVWRLMADGCHPDRRTWEAIRAAGFARVEIEHFEAPVPLVAPHIAGFAVR